MTAGIELYRDGDANPYFSTAIPGGFILGGVDLAAGTNSGNVTDANLANGRPFYYLQGAGAQLQPTVSFSGTTMTYTANPDGDWTGRLFYGIR
jgi:hypothetical protein